MVQEMKTKKIAYLLANLLLIFAFTACNHEEDIPETSKLVALTVTIPQITESDETTELAPDTAKTPSATQLPIVPAGNGMTLEASLERNTPTSTRGSIALATGVKYRVIAFKQGNVTTAGYISYADFVVGTTGSVAGELHVPTGSAYTFVCYSLNTTSLPTFNLNSLNVAANPATDDLLYAKFNQTITVASSTVSFSFAHKFSQVTVIADASSLGKNITAISSTLSPNYSATLTLADGTLTAGTSTARTIPWGTFTASPFLNASACTVFTNGSTAISVSIPSITIGGTTKTNFTATFGGNSMQPGYKYTLRLRFKSSGVVIGGLTWAPGNLIKSGSTYMFTSTQEYYAGGWNWGDYWNWCVLDPTDYTNFAASYNTASDPCKQVAPAGTWRMPSSSDFTALINSGLVRTTKNGVKGVYFGTTSLALIYNGGSYDYVFLPAAGLRAYGDTSLSYVGADGFYWSITPHNTGAAYILNLNSASPSTTSSYGCAYGLSVRCVK